MPPQMECPKCNAALSPADETAAGNIVCPKCGHQTRLKRLMSDKEAGAVRKRKGKKKPKPRSATGLIVGLVVGGGALTLVVVVALAFFLLRKGNGGNRAQGAVDLSGEQVADDGSRPTGAVIIDEGPAPAAPPPRAPWERPKAPAVHLAAISPLPALDSEDAAAVPWQGQPDPARDKPPVLPAQAHLHIRGGNPPLLAARGGPFAIDVVPNRGAQPDKAFMGDDDG